MNRPLIGKPKEIPKEVLESEFRKSAPPVLYKYRSWGNNHHKNALLESQIWFSSPRQLNDLYDIRLAYTFNSEEVYTPEFFAKLKLEFPQMTSTAIGTRDFEVALENHYQLIKNDPQKWFLNNQASVRQSNAYDEVGLFSTTTNPLDQLMWAHYADSHKGYCIGYDSFLLWQAKMSIFGKAHYIGTPINYSFLDNNPENFIDLFIKSKQWSYENEYRLVTFVENDDERLVTLETGVIKEVILGSNISVEAEDQIIKCLKSKYESKILLYKIEESNIAKLGLKKVFY